MRCWQCPYYQWIRCVLGALAFAESIDLVVAQEARTPSFSQSAPKLRDLTDDSSEPSLFPEGSRTTPPRITFSSPERRTQDGIDERETPPFDRNGEARDLTVDSFGNSSAFNADQTSRGLSGTSAAGLRGASEIDRLIARSQNVATLQNYNLKLGPVPFVFGAAFWVDFSDNIEGSSVARTADIVLRPEITVSGSLRLTRYNSLTLQLSLGYLKDIAFPERDRFLPSASAGLDSGSEISFDIKLGNFLINIHDLPEIPRQQIDLVTQRSPTDYSRFNNTAGITVVWNASTQLVASVRYDHINSFSLDASADQLAGTTDQVSGLVVYEFSKSLRIGLNANSSSTTYKTDFLNSRKNSQLGTFVDFQATDYFQIRTTFGYQIGKFGDEGATGDQSSLNSYYGNLSFVHNINAYLSQQISIGHEAQPGTNSNFATLDYVRHQALWQIVKGLRTASSLFYEKAEESGGLFAQKFNRYGGGLSFGFDITRDLICECQYSYTRRDAPDAEGIEDIQSLGYFENRLTIGLRYAF